MLSQLDLKHKSFFMCSFLTEVSIKHTVVIKSYYRFYIEELCAKSILKLFEIPLFQYNTTANAKHSNLNSLYTSSFLAAFLYINDITSSHDAFSVLFFYGEKSREEKEI